MTQKKLQWIIAAVCGGLLVIATVVTLTMGGGSGYPPGRGPVSREEMGWHPFGGGQEDEDLAEVTRMKDAMCACRDSTCVDKVQAEYEAWMKSMEAKYRGDVKPDTQLMVIGEQMAKCMSDAMSR